MVQWAKGTAEFCKPGLSALWKPRQILHPAQSWQILSRHDDGAMIIGCGDDALAIDRLQPAGKSAMAASDFQMEQDLFLETSGPNQPMTRRILIAIEYDGGPFVGWQRQDNGPSVQTAIENAPKPLFMRRYSCWGWRTDAGCMRPIRQILTYQKIYREPVMEA